MDIAHAAKAKGGRSPPFLVNLGHASPLPALQPVSVPAPAARPAAGLPVAIATGGSRPQVTKSLSAVGLLEGFFDAIVTANDVAHGKPHPETFLRAAELIGVEPKHCVG